MFKHRRNLFRKPTTSDMSICIFISFILTLVCLVNIEGYGSYRDGIPNGHNVPHPCKANVMWPGVGHLVKDGGGNRNPFGLDFKIAGKIWTQELCQKDSDGDGLSNGEELGDPSCSWTSGDSQPVAAKISHPGVCEPWTDPKCQGQLSWLATTCESETFVCDAINSPDIQNMTIRFPLTDVPMQETTYMCMEFDLDLNDTFHLVATKAIIDNANVMHHAVIFGCTTVAHPIRSSPHQCGMVASYECGRIVDVWTLGFAGTCLNENLGIKIGNGGYTRIALQFHWNNPSLDTPYKDQSGMVLYYTSTLRSNNAGVYTIGADYLNIPPHMANTQQTSVCSGTCTQAFTNKIYVVSAFNHMHYLGAAQKAEVFRNGIKVRDITDDGVYNYDSPVNHVFDPPLEILPGDTITTTCVYNSLTRNTTTYFGDATSAEMCFVFLTYYPQENIQEGFCTSWKSLPNCEIWNAPYKGCEFYQFNFGGDAVAEATKVGTTCYAGCSDACYQLIDGFLGHACMQGDMNDYTRNIFSNTLEGRTFFDKIDKCVAARTVTKPTATDDPTASANSHVPFFIMFLTVFSIWYAIM